MSNAWMHRLGHDARPAEEATLFGVWRVGGGDASAQINSVSAQAGDWLVPVDERGGWTRQGANQARGRFLTASLPSRSDGDTLLQLGRTLAEHREGWDDWIQVTPLHGAVDEVRKDHPVELALAKCITRLEFICRQPRSHLRVEIERGPVARARRIPLQAYTHLAAHSEDWERRTITGVRPARILSEICDEQVDLYENRMVVRLCDKLDQFLRPRLFELKRTLGIMRDVQAWYRLRETGTHLLHQRLSVLLAEFTGLETWIERTQEKIARLSRLHGRVLGMMDSSLYQSIPRQARIADQLRRTNILQHDDNYRHAAELWREVVKWQSKRLSPAGEYERYQNVCRSFESFCGLLVMRALQELNATPAGQHAQQRVDPGIDLPLRHGDFRLTWDRDGSLHLESRTGRSLCIVPLPGRLAALSDSEWELARKQIGLKEGSSPVLVLYLATVAQGDEDGGKMVSNPVRSPLTTIGNEPAAGWPRNCGFIPVAPWEVASTERVMRALRWFMAESDYLAIPHSFDQVPASVHSVLLQPCDWLRQDEGGAWVILRRPLEWEHEQLRTKLMDLEAHLPTARRRGEEDGRKAITAFRERLLTSAEALPDLGDCPACGTKANPARQMGIGDRGYYCYECCSCNCRWGTRICGSCTERFPILLSGKAQIPTRPEPGWLDHTFGGDVLAIPVAFAAGEMSFVCPNCGEA